MNEKSQSYSPNTQTYVEPWVIELANVCKDELFQNDTLKNDSPYLFVPSSGPDTSSQHSLSSYSSDSAHTELLKWVVKCVSERTVQNPEQFTSVDCILYKLLGAFLHLSHPHLAQICGNLIVHLEEKREVLSSEILSNEKLSNEIPSIDALLLLANYFEDKGMYLRAVQNFQKIKKIDESRGKSTSRSKGKYHSESYNRIGLIFMKLDQHDQALMNFQLALKSDPYLTQAILNMGVAYQHLGKLDQATECFERVLKDEPGNAFAHYNLGVSRFSYGIVDKAEDALERALELNPSWADALYNLGVIKSELKDYSVALNLYKRVTYCNPTHLLAHYNSGVCYFELLRYEQAIKSYSAALQCDPQHVRTHWNIAHCYLITGDLANGFKHYEWRWRHNQLENKQKQRTFEQPLWIGQSIPPPAVLLIHAEQGFGDTLQFIRYVDGLVNKGLKIIVEVQPALKSLIKSSLPEIGIFARGEQLPDFDFHSPLMSLPLALGLTSIAQVTSPSAGVPIPYLRVDQNLSIYWGQRLDALLKTKRKRIGLIWSSGYRPDQVDTWERNKERNIDLKLFKALSELPVDVVSLQIGEIPRKERESLPKEDHFLMLDLSQEIKDFSDTAAIAQHLDLIISVDTSTAHLCAGLGLNTWILIKANACWRWFLDTDTSPWYPSAKVFRQKNQGDWQEVTQRVIHLLGEELNQF